MAKNILLIDDDQDDRLFFQEAMDTVAPNISCYTASSGKEAFGRLTDKGLAFPDLIFLDVNLPIMNAWQFLAVFQKNEGYRHIPVIVYSTSSQLAEIEKAHEMGALYFFTKPHNFSQLKDCLKAVSTHLQTDSLQTLSSTSSCFVAAEHLL